MNESTLTPLKILVERAVRPVRASMACKRKMREELLAHVSAVYEEEAARLGDERTALERTAQRFGEPTELTGQLQGSVPAIDSIEYCVDWLWFRPGESALRRAVRHALLMEAIALMFLLTVWRLVGRGSDWPTEAVSHLAPLLLAMGCMVFSITMLADWMREVLLEKVNPSWPKAALGFAACSSVFPLVAWESGWGVSLKDLLSMVFFTVASMVWMLFSSWALAHVFTARMRNHREWATLRID